eukprot:344112-Chlamydomonas_euryale.AAC.2
MADGWLTWHASLYVCMCSRLQVLYGVAGTRSACIVPTGTRWEGPGGRDWVGGTGWEGLGGQDWVGGTGWAGLGGRDWVGGTGWEGLGGKD